MLIFEVEIRFLSLEEIGCILWGFFHAGVNDPAPQIMREENERWKALSKQEQAIWKLVDFLK